MFRALYIAIALLTSVSTFAQTIERPTVKVGDECHYDIFDNLRKDAQGNPEKIAESRLVVIGVEGDRITANRTHTIFVSRDTEDLEDGTQIFDRDLNVVEVNGCMFEPAYPSRFYPLTPGCGKE